MAALMRLTDESQQKWLTVMVNGLVNEIMSSKESGSNDQVVVHSLPWRSEYVHKIIHTNDSYCKARKSAQAK